MSSTGNVNDDNAYTNGPWRNDPVAVLLDDFMCHEAEAPKGCDCGKCRVLAALDSPPLTRPFELHHYAGKYLS